MLLLLKLFRLLQFCSFSLVKLFIILIENNLYLSNPELKVFGLSMLELVKAIEEKNSPHKIVTDFDFENLFKYFEQTEVEAVVLGCTHFPYIKEELEKITKLSIIDVGIFMIESLKSK